MSSPLFAGIDGGGTKTVVVLVDANGVERARVLTSTSNAAVVGHETAGQVLRTALSDAMHQAGQDGPMRAAWFGLSGSDRPEDHALLGPFIAGLSSSMRMTNDAELILGALPGAVGIAVVSGTGSIAVGHNARGERTRSGGWGQVIGDEGSGYDLARRMFEAFAREADGRGQATSLTGRISSTLSLAEPHQLIQWVYGPETSKGDIAGLSRLVVEEADAGDAVAQTIVMDAAIDLAETTGAAARRLGFEGRLPLAMTGGLLIHVGRFREIMLDRLRREWPALEYAIVTDPALTAACSLARAPVTGAVAP
jgi:N-acetylglucosamine kinase-like BadF-type ATPase